MTKYGTAELLSDRPGWWVHWNAMPTAKYGHQFTTFFFLIFFLSMHIFISSFLLRCWFFFFFNQVSEDQRKRPANQLFLSLSGLSTSACWLYITLKDNRPKKGRKKRTDRRKKRKQKKDMYCAWPPYIIIDCVSNKYRYASNVDNVLLILSFSLTHSLTH